MGRAIRRTVMTLRKISLLSLTVFLTCFSSVALPGGLIGQERTELSQRASQLELRMTRPAVIRLLGAPTWASIPGDTGAFALEVPEIGLELRWKNRPCLPVVVAFDGNLRVNGWDEGRVCLDPPDLADPSPYYSCDKANRRHYCLAEPLEIGEASRAYRRSPRPSLRL